MAETGAASGLEQERLRALHEVALAVNASLDLDIVLPQILARACGLLSARKGSIMLLDEAGLELTIAVAHGLSDEVVAATRLQLGEGVAGTAAASGEPRRLAPGTRQRDGAEVSVPAAICVPLQVGDAVIGVLNVSDRLEADEFSEDDLQLALLFAAQSAVAIRNARAFEEQEHKTLELRALRDVSISINESLDLTTTLEGVLERATRLSGARKGSIMLRDENGTALSIAVAHGLSKDVIRKTLVKLGEGIAGEVALTGRPRKLAGGVKAAGSVKAGDQHLTAAMSVPLQSVGRTIGVLNVSDRLAGGDFTDHDLEFLIALGTQAAAAINNAQLYDDLKTRADALVALNEISRALTASRDRDEVLHQVLDNGLRLLRCHKGSLMLLQTDGRAEDEYDPLSPIIEVEDERRRERHLAIVVARGLPDEVIESTRIMLGQGPAGHVAATGQIAIFGQGEITSSSSSESGASLCLPLRAKDQIIGVLNLAEHEGGEFEDDEVQLAMTLASQAATAIENAQLYDDLRDQFVHSIRVIANAIDARDPYTRGHSERVALYSRMMAEELGLPEEEVETIYYAGLLHDVGKIGVRDNILLKEGRLTDDEFTAMKNHPVKSAEIIYPVKQLRRILPGLRHHHERFSARGYPDGLHEEQIPLMARIIGVADTYDAMTSDRPYRKGLPRRVALEELAKNRGAQFDPKCVNAFLELVRRGEIGQIDGQGPEGEQDVETALAAAEEAVGGDG